MRTFRMVERPVLQLALALAMATLLVMPAVCQQRPASPMAGTPDTLRYPSGGRLQTQYESVNQPVSVPLAREGMRAATAGLAAAASIQGNLPDGFTLGAASTSHLIAAPRPFKPEFAATSDAPPAASDPTEKFITVYPLAYQGIPLSKGSDYLSIVNGEGRLLVTRKRGVPTKVDATQASIPARDAITLARQSAGPQFAATDPDKVKADLEIWVDDQQNGNLAWTFSLAAPSMVEPAVRRYWVAATGSPRVLHWESEVHHTHSGIVSGNLWTASPTAPVQPTANRTLEHLEVRRNSDMTTQITGADGRYGYTTASGAAEIRAKLRGPFFYIDNQTGAAMESALTGPDAPPLNLNFGASSEDQLAQTSAFFWSNFSRNLARSILGPADLAALQVRTNINSTCNAYWNGSSINFFKSAGAGGCPNTAYSDVVLHEYGHGIDAAKGGIVDGGYSEGFGDALAVLGTRQPCVGRDFFGPGTCLRPASDVVLWPAAGGVHNIGRPYAGFVWELVQQLKQSYSEDDAYVIATRLVLAAAAANPSSVADAVHLTFVADDNDGNLANGSPHFRALANAADSRTIPRPPNPLVAGGALVASASFPWGPAKVVSANSNILQATIQLDRPGKLHISANTSARSTGVVQFQTGVYNNVGTNAVWTDSYRNISVPVANQWTTVSTLMAINLPAGTHTIYWKIWITGASVTLSSGVLLLEGFEPATGPSALTAAAPSAVTAPGSEVAASAAAIPARTISLSRDEAGQAVTVVK